MRRVLPSLAMVLGVLLLAQDARAQFFGNANVNDPFFLYYGFYLPRQAAMAAQPRPQETINALAAARQYTALTERASLYDPIQPFGTYDPNQLFGERAGARYGGMAVHGTNISGTGPSGYFNRTHTYFPGLRTGRSAGIRGAAVASGYQSRSPRGVSLPQPRIPNPTAGIPRY